MARNRIGADGHELEWSIQDRYFAKTKELTNLYVPLCLEFHKGNAAGGKTFMTKGIPDTLTFYRKLISERRTSDTVYEVYIEFKRHNGVISPDQKVMIATLKALGKDVLVCYDAETAMQELGNRIFGQPKGKL